MNSAPADPATTHPPRRASARSTIQLFTQDGVPLSTLPGRNRWRGGFRRQHRRVAERELLGAWLPATRHDTLHGAWRPRARNGLKLARPLACSHPRSWAWRIAARPGASYLAVGCEDGSISQLQVVFSTVHGLYGNR